MKKHQEFQELSFPFESMDEPDGCRTIEVAEGVFWLKLPLPMVLSYINIWLLRDGDGWTVVDTGFKSQKSQALWLEIYNRVLERKPIHKVVTTHMHPDHIGQAEWLCQRFNCELYMSQAEFYYGHYLGNVDPQGYMERMKSFYKSLGILELDEESRAGITLTPEVFSCLPQSYNRLRGGETLFIDGQPWHLVHGSGHSPEHICLHSSEKKILISGDQVLPRISSNISVYAEEPEADPLTDWLSSCRALAQNLPEDLLVLPAHGQPFHGIRPRLRGLIEGHESQLKKLRQFLAEPHSCIDTLPILFHGELAGFNRLIAATEALAHINYLLVRGEVKRFRSRDNVYLYQLS